MAEYQTSKTGIHLSQLSKALSDQRLQAVRRMLSGLSPAEIALLLESLPTSKRLLVWKLADSELDGEILVHVNDEVRSALIAAMEDAALVSAVEGLDLDDVADIIDDLPDTVTDQYVSSLDRADRTRLAEVMAYPEDSAGGLMDPQVITVRPDTSLEVVARYLRAREDLPDFFDQLFVVDRNGHYLGRLKMTAIVTEDPSLSVSQVMDGGLPAIPVDASAAEVASEFEYRDYTAAPVVDSGNRLLGRITVDDVVDVIREMADHSVLSRAGLDEEEDMFAPVLVSAKRRTVWLGINLLTALLAAWVIGRFESALETIVALAILMPVVASMGGIAGTQTLTLMIRGLATGTVSRGNAVALLSKELSVGLFNALLWSLVIGGVALFWFGDSSLGGVIAAAIAINLLAAALAGVGIPLLLDRLRIDPALAGGVVLTTVTDVVGFVSFLGLASWLLLS